MPFERLVAPSLTSLFINKIEAMIFSGELKIGEKLPTERELGAQMNVSRAVINGGINKLADIGFLEVAPRKGVYVADYIRKGNIDVLEALMEYNGEYFNADFIEPIIHFHLSLEPYIMEYAAKNVTDENLRELRGILDIMKTSRDPGECATCLFDFFHVSAVSSSNVVWPLLVQTLKPAYISSSKHFFGENQHALMNDGLEQLYNQLVKHDSKTAREYTIELIHLYRDFLEDAYANGSTKKDS